MDKKLNHRKHSSPHIDLERILASHEQSRQIPNQRQTIRQSLRIRHLQQDSDSNELGGDGDQSKNRKTLGSSIRRQRFVKEQVRPKREKESNKKQKKAISINIY